MNNKLLKRNNTIEDEALILKYSASLNIHPYLTRLLLSRGLKTEEAIFNYLNPNKKNFYDPFLLKGMAQAVQRIESAIENDERVVVYGDYDCDGICAAAILSLYLSSRGLNVYTHIPNRIGDGYGLNIESIEKIIENCCPDLIITCDCGISGRDEVDHAIDLGVDFIVTDHHEVADQIPNCIVVNPKQNDCRYPYAFLCGAGVAMKVVHALGGLDAAMEYLELAALATIADLVPLLDENRLIVQLGLIAMSEKKNLGLKMLFEDQKLTFPVSSNDVAYKIAPRINAAGRMGDAYRAFELVTIQNTEKVKEIITSINEDNVKRKEFCDSLYNEAIRDLQYEDLINNRAIVLSNPEWEKGITGILAAKLAGDFRRPTFIMVNSGEQYKGTARSVPGINIYELLSSASNLLIEFGGHSQAAGFSIKKENILAFKELVNAELKKYPEEMFQPNIEYDLEVLPEDIDLKLVKALEAIEPSGNSNTRPYFKTTVNKLSVLPCKSNFNHTNITTENGLQIIAFNFYSNNQFLVGDMPKDIIFELQLNSFGNKESTKGILRGVSPTELFVNDIIAKANFLKTLAYRSNNQAKFSTYPKEGLNKLIENNIYGTLIIAGCKNSYTEFVQKHNRPYFIHEFLYASNKNNYSRIMVSPDFDNNLMLAAYNKIIFLDSPPALAVVAYIAKKTKADIFLPEESNESLFFEDLLISRAEFGRYFEAIRQNISLQSTNILSYYKLLAAQMQESNLSQFIACALVFTELNLLKAEKDFFQFKVNREVKRDLTESKIYNYLADKCAKTE